MKQYKSNLFSIKGKNGATMQWYNGTTGRGGDGGRTGGLEPRSVACSAGETHMVDIEIRNFLFAGVLYSPVLQGFIKNSLKVFIDTTQSVNNLL
jgi:hypothetical protein